MQAVRAVDGMASVVDVDEPQGDGVLIDVHSVGICGSDLRLVDWLSNVPITLGHEVAGVTADRRAVAVEPLVSCRSCKMCAAGHHSRCQGSPPPRIVGVSLDGGMAPRCLVPETTLVPLPAGVEPGVACLVEPLAVAVHGLRRLSSPTGSLAVVGGGAIGLSTVAAARFLGTTAAMEARHEHQRAAADRLGATLVGDSSRFDVVVEAAGTASALERSIELCQPGGTVLVLGSYWGDVPLPAMALCAKEVTLVPAVMYGRGGSSRDIDVAAQVLASDPAIADSLITHRFALADASAAFAAASDKQAGVIKVVIDPRR